MKIKHFFGLAVIAAMTASCSSNEDLGTAGPGTGTNETGVGYASFTINLPTTSGTRADANPDFQPGDANEYKVNDATLLIFKKGEPTKEGETPKEGDYTFVESAELGSMAPWKDPNETGVTTHAKITAKLENVAKTDGYYALVLLNNGTGTKAKVALPTTPTTEGEGMKFSDWNAAANAKDIANYTNGFYMANAPLFKDNKVTTLVAINKDNIYPTEEQAAKGTATDIYVERGLAKVTLKTGKAATGNTDDNYTVTGVTYKGDKVTIKNWALDVTNTKTFPIHNVDGLSDDYTNIWTNTDTPAGSNGANTQRFVDNNKDTKAKRVYWGKDPNYDKSDLCSTKDANKTALKAEFNYVENKDVKVEPSKALYCLENTFNLANMMQGQTTRVVFKAKYTPKGFKDGDTFYKIGKNTAIWNKTNLEDEIKAAVVSVVTGATTDNTTVKLDADGYDITAAGTHYVKAANIIVKISETETATISDANITAINTQLGLKETEKVGISTYAGGESYYIARIKHFGDALTKWESGPYDDKKLEYLGRYGVLRNNWYELTVNSVSGPGYPSVPEVKPNTPDDEDDKYINVSVKILDWAKRSQSVDL